MTRSVPRPARRAVRAFRAARAVQAARAARAGLALAAVGIVVVGATGGTAFAGPGQFNRPSPDGGTEVRSHGVHATGGDREVNDRKAGKLPAAPNPKAPAKAGTTTKAASKPATKAKAKPRKAAHKPAAKPPRKAPAGNPSAPGAAALSTPVQQVAAAPTVVTVTAQSPSSLKVSWKVNIGETGIVDHFEVTAIEDATKTCRTRTSAATSCVVPALTQGATYSFTVRAIAVPDSGARSSVLSALSAPATVGAPAAAQTTPAKAPATEPARDPHQAAPASTGAAHTNPATRPAAQTATGTPRTASHGATGTSQTAAQGTGTTQAAAQGGTGTTQAAAQGGTGTTQTAAQGATGTTQSAAQGATGATQTANGAVPGSNAAARTPNRAAQDASRAAQHRTTQDSTRRLPGTDKGRDTAQAGTAGQHHGATDGFGALLGLPNGTTDTAVVTATAETRDGRRTRPGVLALLGLGALALAGLVTAAVTRGRRVAG
ncbi:fibronectin type III domain-containing protein [Dactylosporangium sp. CA-152071]|uniref:fibronectin type III domain-containing protein n=1 Tax=Dactylosporangium sp. CA-152071 TaxID=3239933 RepID=UPI003D9359E4